MISWAIRFWVVGCLIVVVIPLFDCLLVVGCCLTVCGSLVCLWLVVFSLLF